MRVCLRPEACPFGAGASGAGTGAAPASGDVMSRWERALGAALPGDRSLVSALIGDIAALAR
jgi:hypothetical protein